MTANETLQLITQHWCNLNDLMKLAGVSRNSTLKIKKQIKTALESEGIYVELNRTATSRNYKAKYIESLSLEE